MEDPSDLKIQNISGIEVTGSSLKRAKMVV